MYIRITKITDLELSFEKTATEWAVLAVGMMLSLLNMVSVESEAAIDPVHPEQFIKIIKENAY